MIRLFHLTVLAAVLILSSFPAWCAGSFSIQQQGASNNVEVSLERDSASATRESVLEIDDAAAFRTPVWTHNFHGNRLQFDAVQAGLAPGTDYWVRLNRAAPVKRLRLAGTATLAPYANCAALRASWEAVGRPIVERRSNAHWQADTGRWVPVLSGLPSGTNIYFVELFLRSGLEWAQSCNDLAFYEEAGQYYLAMLQQTIRLGVAERRSPDDPEMKTAMMSGRTFPAGGRLVGDADLGQAQWLYPAAKLERLITLLPAARQSARMREFTSQFTHFLVEEQLLRFLYRPARPAPGGGPDVNRIAVWKATMRGLKGKISSDTAMSDVDLWLLASSAEVLGAHANDPELVNVSNVSLEQLRAALDTGIRLFRSKRTLYPDTLDFQHRKVGSATYFNGDYDGYDELAFSAVSGPDFPTADKQRATPGISWDTSHAYRIPVFMRALYDNRKATGSDFPTLAEMKLLTNQYVYRVFNGDFSRPLFRNYLDGNDTWFRVDLGSGTGYPPSASCNDKVPNRPCEAPGNVVGWGLLDFANADLTRLEKSMIDLGFQSEESARQFRDQHYTYTWPYGLVSQFGKDVYGDTLSFVIADNSSLLPAGSGAHD